jgi:hypothetical protein
MGDAAEVVGGALSPAIIVLASGIKSATELLFGLNTEIDQLTIKSQESTNWTWEKAKANKALVLQWKALQEEAKRLTPIEEKRRDLQIETNMVFAASVPLIDQQQLAVNDLNTSWQKWVDLNEDNLDSMAKGVAMSGNLAEASRALANQYIVEGVFGAVKGAMTSVPFPLNLLAAGGAAVAANALFNSIVPVQAAATGADFVTNGTQMLMVGDNPSGRERVQVTPMGGDPNINGPQGNTFIFGDINGLDEYTVEQLLIPAINRATSQGRAAIA